MAFTPLIKKNTKVTFVSRTRYDKPKKFCGLDFLRNFYITRLEFSKILCNFALSGKNGNGHCWGATRQGYI